VLGIETEDDIQNLSHYFLRYTKSMPPGDAQPLPPGDGQRSIGSPDEVLLAHMPTPVIP